MGRNLEPTDRRPVFISGQADQGGEPQPIFPRPQPALPAAADRPGPSGAGGHGIERACPATQGGSEGRPTAAAPLGGEVVVEYNEPVRDRTEFFFQVSLADDELPTKNSTTYIVELDQRLLPGKRVTPSMASPVSEFRLVSNEGQSFPCERELLRNLCRSLDISSSWNVPEIQLGAGCETTRALIEFASTGWIKIEDKNVMEILEAADFLGFESLLELCGVYMSRPAFAARKVVAAHERFAHVGGISEAFDKKLNSLPLGLFHRENRWAGGLLQSLKIGQLRKLLSNDGLLVTSEDQTALMISRWLEKQRATAEEKKSLLQLIRYPFLTRRMRDMFKQDSFWLPTPEVGDFGSENSCRSRAGYNRHLHILWKEHCSSMEGPMNLAVSCITWNPHVRKLEETLLARASHEPLRGEERESAQFAIAGRKIVKASFNRHHDEIMISEIDMAEKTSVLKLSMPLSPEEIVERPALTIVKGNSNLTLAYYDGSTEIVSIDTDTWRFQEIPHVDSIRALRRFPINPARFEICGDCAVGIINKRLVISKPDFTDAVDIHVPVCSGYFFDMDRIDDTLYILEDRSGTRCIEQCATDLIHCVDLREKVFIKSIEVPWYPDPVRIRDRYVGRPKSTLQLIKGDRELFIFTQNDSRAALRIITFDVDTQQCQLSAVIEPPQPNRGDPERVHVRYCLCAVPPSILPCDKSSLKELGESFAVPTAE